MDVFTPSEQLAGPSLAKLATAMGKAGRTPGIEQLADVWHRYTDVVFNAMNGRVESQFQTAMLGKELRDHPLMSEHTVKLSQKAIDEAARGLRNTATQAALGRKVDRAYGKYGKFSPSQRRAVAAYTPFIAWSLNAITFVASVLPRDHPVLTSLLAPANEASEEWRRQKGLVSTFFSHFDGQLPDFLRPTRAR